MIQSLLYTTILSPRCLGRSGQAWSLQYSSHRERNDARARARQISDVEYQFNGVSFRFSHLQRTAYVSFVVEVARGSQPAFSRSKRSSQTLLIHQFHETASSTNNNILATTIWLGRDPHCVIASHVRKSSVQPSGYDRRASFLLDPLFSRAAAVWPRASKRSPALIGCRTRKRSRQNNGHLWIDRYVNARF